ncbi:PDDEXK nuclease domain-containing protein [Terrimonas sp. NA20]|uniref:PDDEXK nuclease domain-containing protein n=1 Tax=Terrimonas ginsenosidimutans TaxID=2908004 RepID=A0ABS9L083_9BACT|nr:PDDEXK nuclease domain-containing protein [Terrimonas ginsenosidimutans]MCG2617988.1 PDDEXK nuclease domain-containing protein [Terrimonas ginsenosidimutans]
MSTQLEPSFIEEIKSLILQSRENAVRTVDHLRVILYWNIGKRIFEEEQGGKDRADYGNYIIKSLAVTLQPEFGTGFSIRQLERYRQFYRAFPIASALRTQFSWTHYKLLLSLDSQDKIYYYQREAARNNWTARQLERQINSHLYERLLASSDKQSVLAAASQENVNLTPSDIIKDPMVLEFLGLKQDANYYEKDLESGLITHLQEFLLELGNGFSFVARQKRIHLDGDDFFIDLVFYNRLLQCFVLIELLRSKVTHQDLGQLQMYVNYYDRFEKQSFENPTVGILLCASKNEAMVKVTLPENSSIIASKYKLYMPSETQLLEQLRSGLDAANKEEN